MRACLPFDLITGSASICADEARHADYALLMARALTGDDVSIRVERERVADRMATNVVDIERRFWQGRDAPASATAAARALGVLESEGQRAAVREVMESEIVPALDSYGLGASHAWRVRRRGR